MQEGVGKEKEVIYQLAWNSLEERFWLWPILSIESNQLLPESKSTSSLHTLQGFPGPNDKSSSNVGCILAERGSPSLCKNDEGRSFIARGRGRSLDRSCPHKSCESMSRARFPPEDFLPWGVSLPESHRCATEQELPESHRCATEQECIKRTTTDSRPGGPTQLPVDCEADFLAVTTGGVTVAIALSFEPCLARQISGSSCGPGAGVAFPFVCTHAPRSLDSESELLLLRQGKLEFGVALACMLARLFARPWPMCSESQSEVGKSIQVGLKMHISYPGVLVIDPFF